MQNGKLQVFLTVGRIRLSLEVPTYIFYNKMTAIHIVNKMHSAEKAQNNKVFERSYIFYYTRTVT